MRQEAATRCRAEDPRSVASTHRAAQTVDAPQSPRLRRGTLPARNPRRAVSRSNPPTNMAPTKTYPPAKPGAARRATQRSYGLRTRVLSQYCVVRKMRLYRWRTLGTRYPDHLCKKPTMGSSRGGALGSPPGASYK